VLLGLDPGQSDCGVSTLRNKRLVEATWLQAPHRLENGPRGWREMAEIVKNWATVQELRSSERITAVAFERMHPRGDDDPAKLLTIMGLLAVSVWVCALFPQAEHVGFFPTQWRGSAKGRGTYCAHVDERLDPNERANLVLPAKRFQHNVYAAIGIALKAVGRFEFERVYSST
jgi:hypothetical protein